MNLLEFITLIRQGASVEAVAASRCLNPDAEELGVYMTPKVSLTNELAFFDLEQVLPTIFITVGGKKYESFFSASQLADLIPEYADFLGTAATPQTIAEAILNYHEYDA